jgi:hypothetical protein
MSRSINFVRKAIKPSFFSNTAPVAISVQFQRSAVVFNYRAFGTDAHAHDSHAGKDEVQNFYITMLYLEN